MHTPPVAIAITMVLLAALGAACGDDAAPSATVPSETVPPETAPSETVPSKTGSPSLETSGSETFPITVEHAFGVTVVPAEPQRVVTVGVTEHDTVLALGVTPVGVTDWYGDQPFATWPWAQGELGGAEPEVLSSADGLQYERIAALEPDLIIGTNAGLDDAMYEQLSAIAPTIAHPAGTDAYFSPWDQQALLVGQALGREPEVRLIIDEVKAGFAEAAAEHPEFAGTDIVFLQNAFYDGEAIAYQDGLSTAFLTDLGFTIPSELAAFDAKERRPTSHSSNSRCSTPPTCCSGRPRRPVTVPHSKQSPCTRRWPRSKTVTWSSPTGSPPVRSTSRVC